MNCSRILIVLISLFLFSQAVQGANFQNLNFESTSLSPNGPGGLQPVEVALPGWAASFSDSFHPDILYNELFIGTAFVGLSSSPLYVLEGQFSALLFPGAGPLPLGLPVSVSLAQSGFIPANANTLQFHARVSAGHPTVHDFFGIYVDGQRLQVFPAIEGSGTITATFTADISAYAGRDVNLQFTSFAYSGYPNSLVLDEIAFINVPEPSMWALFGLGALALGYRLRRRAS